LRYSLDNRKSALSIRNPPVSIPNPHSQSPIHNPQFNPHSAIAIRQSDAWYDARGMPFRDIAGHQAVLALLSRAVERNTLPQSLIFAGPSGVGKHMTAVALAQLVNCQSAKNGDACGTCASCSRIARRVHPDVVFVEPEDSGAIKIDPIREAVNAAGYRPFEGRRRVIIIDQADTIGVNAQDALLKTLEEPPAASVFVLVTAVPDLLLPTVRSRCQRLRFGRLAPGDVAQVLKSKHDFSDADAHAAASLSDGSIGRALDEASEAFAEARDAAMDLLQAAARTNAPAARMQAALGLPGAGRGKADRTLFGQTLLALSSILRDLGALMSSADERALANADLKDTLQGLLRAYDRERVLGAFAAVDKALDAVDRNASPKIVADWLALQI
jgi:DNA polymerase III subunit delta'